MTDKEILCKRCGKRLIRERKTGMCNSCCKIGRKLSDSTKQIMSIQRKGNKFSLGFKHSKESREKMSLSHKGEKSYQWKGNNLSYSALHCWIKKVLGKAKFCELNPNHKAKRFEWHNIDKKYNRNINDFRSLCPSCHRKIDMGIIEVISYG